MDVTQKQKYLESYEDSVYYILNIDLDNISDSDKLTVEINYNHLMYLDECNVFESISFQELQKLRSAQSKAKNILEIV